MLSSKYEGQRQTPGPALIHSEIQECLVPRWHEHLMILLGLIAENKDFFALASCQAQTHDSPQPTLEASGSSSDLPLDDAVHWPPDR